MSIREKIDFYKKHIEEVTRAEKVTHADLLAHDIIRALTAEPTEADIERVARAICKSHGYDPDDKLNEWPVVKSWKSFIDDAGTAISAWQRRG